MFPKPHLKTLRSKEDTRDINLGGASFITETAFIIIILRHKHESLHAVIFVWNASPVPT